MKNPKDPTNFLPTSGDAHPTRRNVIGTAVIGTGVISTGVISTANALLPSTALASPAEADAEPRAAAVPVTLKINGKVQRLQLEARVTLLDALRENIGMHGTKKGCDHGQCGACTVLVDGERINSCLTLAIMHGGREITTVEGLAQGEKLHPIQAAFIEHDAFQCGYCTPGQLCSAVGLMRERRAQGTPSMTDDEIREGMAGNLCRCGAYPNIVNAVRAVMAKV